MKVKNYCCHYEKLHALFWLNVCGADKSWLSTFKTNFWFKQILHSRLISLYRFTYLARVCTEVFTNVCSPSLACHAIPPRQSSLCIQTMQNYNAIKLLKRLSLARNIAQAIKLIITFLENWKLILTAFQWGSIWKGWKARRGWGESERCKAVCTQQGGHYLASINIQQSRGGGKKYCAEINFISRNFLCFDYRLARKRFCNLTLAHAPPTPEWLCAELINAARLLRAHFIDFFYCRIKLRLVLFTVHHCCIIMDSRFTVVLCSGKGSEKKIKVKSASRAEKKFLRSIF